MMWKLGVVIVAMSLSACKRESKTDQASAKPVALPTVKVTTVAAKEAELPRYFPVTGTLLADRDSEVAADAAGRVVAITVERGQMVKAGTVLAQLDTRTARIQSREASASAELAQSQATLAQTECGRAETLYKGGAMSDAERDRILAQCRQSAAAVSVAQARTDSVKQVIGNANIRAPFDGLIVERFVENGEYVRPDSRIVRLITADPIRLQMAVPESGAGEVKIGGQVSFHLSSFPSESFTANIKYVSPAVREITRDLLVEAVAENKSGKLLPGMFATAKIAMPRQKGVAVPKNAVHTVGALTRLFVVVQDHLEERIVEPGESDGDWLEIRKGVAAGDAVVSPWTDDAKDGAPIQK